MSRELSSLALKTTEYNFFSDMPNPPDTAGMTQEQINELIAVGIKDPVEYARRILGVTIYPKQEEIARAVMRFSNVAAAGCNSSGKTFMMSPVALHGLTVEERLSVLQIAPSGTQSRKVFWTDMNGLYKDSELAQELLGYTEMHSTSFEVDPRRYAQAVTPGDTKALRGYHNTKMLFILDEGNGVDAGFYTAIDGIAASGDVKVVQLGNPTDTSGIFYDSFNDPELGWYTINISAFDSPNIVDMEVPEWFDEDSDAPGVITPENRRKLAYLVWLRRRYLDKRDKMPEHEIPEYRILTERVTAHLTERMFVADSEAKYGRSNHPSWYGQVLGVFPDQSEDQLLPRRVIEAARGETFLSDYDQDFIVFGCDPSGMGKSEWSLAAAQIKCSDQSMMHETLFTDGFHGHDAFEQAIKAMQPHMHRCGWINIDRLGAGERPTVEITRWAAQFGVPVFGFTSQSPSTNPQAFANIKAQAYYFLRDLFYMGAITGINDNLLKQQLLGLKYEITPRGQTKMESKKDMRKRGVDSPDRADALCYAMFPIMHFAPWMQVVGA